MTRCLLWMHACIFVIIWITWVVEVKGLGSVHIYIVDLHLYLYVLCYLWSSYVVGWFQKRNCKWDYFDPPQKRRLANGLLILSLHYIVVSNSSPFLWWMAWDMLYKHSPNCSCSCDMIWARKYKMSNNYNCQSYTIPEQPCLTHPTPPDNWLSSFFIYIQ